MSTNEQGFQPLHGLFVISPCKVAITALSLLKTMKTDRHGQAKILTSDEIQRLFETGFTCDRDRALFGICLYTACRDCDRIRVKTCKITFKGLLIRAFSKRHQKAMQCLHYCLPGRSPTRKWGFQPLKLHQKG